MIIKTLAITNVGEGLEQLDLSYFIDVSVKMITMYTPEVFGANRSFVYTHLGLDPSSS